MKRIFLTVFSVLSLLVLPSCGGWLNLEPEDGVIREKYWQTKEEAESALMGCYAQLLNSEMMVRYFVWGEMRADQVINTSRANSDIIAIRDGEITAENRYCTFSHFYQAINQCNTLIELAPTAQDNDDSFTDLLLKQYQAEAVCIRSLCYFYLARTFRDVPYITAASIYDDQEYSVAKTSQDEIFAHLVEDLLSVQSYIPSSYGTTAESKGRFTLWALKAMLADIYLWQENYAACNEMCTQVINSGQYSLIPVKRTQSQVLNSTGEYVDIYEANEADMNEMFNQLYVQGNSIESIFELQNGTDYNNPFYTWFRPVSGYLTPNTDEMSAFFPSSELSSSKWRDIRKEVSIKQNAIWKWIGLNEAEYRASDASFANWIFYRLPDVMLMKADALTQLAKAAGGDSTMLQEAYDIVETVRARANATETTAYDYMSDSELTPSALEKWVLEERSRELIFEGKRWFDVLRYAKRNDYANLEYLVNLAVRATTPEKVTVKQTKWSTAPYGSHYLPLPQSEIRINKQLVQNEFYN